MKLYHGSERNFEKFNREEAEEAGGALFSDEEDFACGIWFTPEIEIAKRYLRWSEGTVYVYEIEVPGQFAEFIKNEGDGDEYLVAWENAFSIYIERKYTFEAISNGFKESILKEI